MLRNACIAILILLVSSGANAGSFKKFIKEAREVLDEASSSSTTSGANNGSTSFSNEADEQSQSNMRSRIIERPTLATFSANRDDPLFTQGMWKDPRTGLTWSRCLVGQQFEQGVCTNKYNNKFFSIIDAAYEVSKLRLGGYSDWRIPSAVELATLAVCGVRQKLPTGIETIEISDDGRAAVNDKDRLLIARAQAIIVSDHKENPYGIYRCEDGRSIETIGVEEVFPGQLTDNKLWMANNYGDFSWDGLRSINNDRDGHFHFHSDTDDGHAAMVSSSPRYVLAVRSEKPSEEFTNLSAVVSPILTAQKSEREAYQVNLDDPLFQKGVWLDKRTGLMWTRCSFPMTVLQGKCSGKHVFYESMGEAIIAADNASYAGFDDWRIPTVNEVMSIHNCLGGNNGSKKSDSDSGKFIDDNGNEVNNTISCNIGSSQPTKGTATIFPDGWETSYEVAGVGTDRAVVSFWNDSPPTRSGMSTGNSFVSRLAGYNEIMLVRGKEASAIYNKTLSFYRESLRGETIRNAEYEKRKKDKMREQAVKAEQEAARIKQITQGFRANLKVGDKAVQGMVLQLKGPLALIQTYGGKCTMLQGYTCIQRTEPTEQWVRRDELTPFIPRN